MATSGSGRDGAVTRRPRAGRRRVVGPWALVAFLVTAAPAVAGAAGSSPAPGSAPEGGQINVLLLYAAPRLTPALNAMDEAFRSGLASRLSQPVYFYTEYLDLALFTGDEPRAELRALLGQKYRGVKLDLLVASNSSALRFTVRSRAGLFPGVPVVFANVARDAVADLPLGGDVTGVWLNIDWTRTLEAALRLRPETRRVVMIAGTARPDRVWLATARRQLAPYTRRVEVSYLTDLPLETLVKRVAALPADTIILMGSFLRDATGRDLIGWEVVRQVAAAASVPMFGPADTFVGAGAVGGYVARFAAHGEVAAQLAVRVLRGERPPPTVAETSGYEFDARQLARWGFDESRLPPGSVVRFRQPSLWETHKWYIVGGATALALESLLIAGLLVNRTKRRGAQRALAERLRFETLLSDLSSTFITLPAREVDGQIEKALTRIGSDLDVDRAVLADLDERERAVKVTHSWTRAGIEPLAPSLQASAFPWIARRVLEGHVVSISQGHPLPDAAATDRQGMLPLGTRSLVAVPLMVEGIVAGVLAFSTVTKNREWPDALVQRVRLLAEILANARARARAENAARESEDRFRLLADTAPLMIWMADPDGSRTYVNRRWLDLTGRRQEQALGEGWAGIMHPDDRAGTLHTYRDAVARRRPFTIDYRLRHRDGEDRWVLDHGVPRIGEDGTFAGYVGSVIDITALNTALKAVLESNALRSAVFGSLYGHIAAIDGSGVIIAVNRSWTRFAEENGGEAASVGVGANYLDACQRAAESGDPDARRMAAAIIPVLVGKSELERLEYARRTPAGERWFEMTVEPFRRPEGGAVISHVDITRRRHAEEESRRHLEELAHALRVTTLGELGASLAHEINQPLAAIVTNAQATSRLLARGLAGETVVTEALADIAADAKRASEIIRRLRALSRKEHNPQSGLNLNALIDDVLNLLRHDFARKEIAVIRAFEPALPPLPGDPIQLQQVILNLLVNAGEAIVAAREGPREITIATAHRESGTVKVAIRDTGIGATEIDLARMFGRFVSTKPGGLGMGLSISQSIVQAHDGRLWATRNDDRGLTLHLELPCQAGLAPRMGLRT